MGYQEELQAKLAATHTDNPKSTLKSLDISSAQQALINELQEELQLEQYDLDESDILRSIKIRRLLDAQGTLFHHTDCLTLFYAISKADAIFATTLLSLVNIPKKHFLHHLSALQKAKLIRVEQQEILLSDTGKTLAQAIGVDIFF